MYLFIIKNKKYDSPQGTLMEYDLSRIIRTDIKLLSWKSVLSIGLTYLIAVAVTLFISGSIMFYGDSFDGTNNFDTNMRMICYAISGSIWIAAAIGLIIKMVADAISASHFLRKVTDSMFEKKANRMICRECDKEIRLH